MNPISKAWVSYQLRRRFYRWDRSRLEAHQHERVTAILDHARRYSPFYAERLKRGVALPEVPIIDKAIMMRHFDEINTAGLSRDPLIEFKIRQERSGDIGLYREQFSVGLSSGTSGNRGLTVLSRAERELYGCLIWVRNGLPKKIGRVRLLFTLRTNNAAYMEATGLFGPTIVFADYTHSADELLDLLNGRNLNVLAGPPSLLRMIAAKAGRLKHPLKAVVSYAEVLDGKTKDYLERLFDAPVVQIYQCSEGFIASTCRFGNLHINEDTILVEGEPVDLTQPSVQNVILTDLYRTTQPIIRYRLGDLLEFDTDPCPCGSCFRRLKLIHGRSDDIFHLKGTDGETRYLFPDYVRRAINQASGQIIEYQALQHSPEEIEIRLSLEANADRAAITQKVLENLRWRADKIGAALGEVRFSDRPPEPNPRSGKLIRVVRRF